MDAARRGTVGAGTLLVLAPLLLVAGFALGRWSAPVDPGEPPETGDVPRRVAAPGPAQTIATGTTAAPAPLPTQVQRLDPGPQELIPLPGGPGPGQRPGPGQTPGQGQTPAPGQGQVPGQGDCMLFMFRDGRLFQFGGPGAPGAPGGQAFPFGFGGPGTGPGGGPGGPQELYPLRPAPSPGLPTPNVPPPVPSAPMPPPRMSQAPSATPPTGPASPSATPSAAAPPTGIPLAAVPTSAVRPNATPPTATPPTATPRTATPPTGTPSRPGEGRS